MVLPYTQVKYVFGTSAVSPAMETYYGCIMGKGTRLHDLESHGWFVPKPDDCICTSDAESWITYKSGAFRISPEGENGAWPYPKFAKGNEVYIPSVKTYLKGGDSSQLKYVNFFKAQHLAIPYTDSVFRIVKEEGKIELNAETGSAEQKEAAKTEIAKLFAVDENLKITPAGDDSVLDVIKKSRVMIPGTLDVTIKVTDNTDSEHPVITKYKLRDYSSKPTTWKINGTLYVYKPGTDPDTWVELTSEDTMFTSSRLAYTFKDGEYVFTLDKDSSLTYVPGAGIDKEDLTVEVVYVSYKTATYAETDTEGNLDDILDGIITKDMFYLGQKDLDGYIVPDVPDDPDDDPDDDDDDTTLSGSFLAESEDSLIVAVDETTGDAVYISVDDPETAEAIYAQAQSAGSTPAEVQANLYQIVSSMAAVSMTNVKNAFLKATKQKMNTLKPYQGGVITSVLSIDHATHLVTANYVALESDDRRPFIGVAACACRGSSDHPLRITVDLSPQTGVIRVTPSTLTILSKEYEYGETGDTYIGSYDTDPDDRQQLPLGTGSNFVSGYFRLEYEEKIVSNLMTGENGLYFTVNYPKDGVEIEDLVGQMDPRNQLGYAYGLVKELTTADMYVLAITDLQNGCDTLEKYRNIFHIWYVSDDGPQDKFYNWIDHENQKEQSRFRIGYQYCPVKDDVVRTELISAKLNIDVDDAYPYVITRSNAGFVSDLKVIPGDLVADLNNPDTVLTVKSASNDRIELAEKYIPSYFMVAQPDDETDLYSNFSVVYTPSENGGRKLVETTSKVKINYSIRNISNGTITDSDVWEGTLEDANAVLGEYFRFERTPSETNPDIITYTAESIEIPGAEVRGSITECAFDARYESYSSDFKIYRDYTPSEKAERLASDQTNYNMACVTVLTRDVVYYSSVYNDDLLGPDTKKLLSTISADVDASFYTRMPDYATPGLIFGTKLSVQPHMPLTYVSFSLPGMGEVLGMREFSHDDLEKLLDAGYCMINSEVGGLPYCETDCTVGYPMYGDSDRGLLSKITPVLMYGKDVYNVTKRWKGPMNTGTPELLSGLGTSLVVLKQKYTQTRYNLLGTLLKKVSDASIRFDGSHIIIDHHISSQDPARYIDNTVYVE